MPTLNTKFYFSLPNNEYSPLTTPTAEPKWFSNSQNSSFIRFSDAFLLLFFRLIFPVRFPTCFFSAFSGVFSNLFSRRFFCDSFPMPFFNSFFPTLDLFRAVQRYKTILFFRCWILWRERDGGGGGDCRVLQWLSDSLGVPSVPSNCSGGGNGDIPNKANGNHESAFQLAISNQIWAKAEVVGY